MLTRRGFLFDAAALGAGFAFGAAPTEGRKAILRVGIMSDIHIRKSAKVITGGPSWGAERFERVIAAYRDMGADAIMVPGDIADWGLVSQLVEAGKAWDRVFPNGRGLGGKKVEKVFIYGNHDYFPAFRFSEKNLVEQYLGLADQAARDAYAKKEGISVNFAKAWDEAFHEEWSQTFVKEVNGFTFIGGSWDSEGREMADLVGKTAPKLDPKKPFFVFQHRAFGGTCWAERGLSARSLDADGGETTKVLAKYPNAFAFSGHNHFTLTDPNELWKGPFTALGCSSLRFVVKAPPAGGWKRQMSLSDKLVPGYQSLFMSVYDDEVVIEAHEWQDHPRTKKDAVPAWHIRRPLV